MAGGVAQCFDDEMDVAGVCVDMAVEAAEAQDTVIVVEEESSMNPGCALKFVDFTSSRSAWTSLRSTSWRSHSCAFIPAP